MAVYEDLLLEKDGNIAIMTLNAPDKLNALTAGMRASLPLAIADISKDDDIRVLIVTGAGRGFCSGADTGMLKGRLGGIIQNSRADVHVLVGWYGSLFPRVNKPVIAAINGACVGGGLGLALGCDIRVAAETAKMGAVQIARGLIPDGGMTYVLPRMLGTSKALELMFNAEVFTAADALQMGLVSRVVPLAELMNAAREIAARIAKQAPVAVELTKKMVWRTILEDIDRHIEMETAAQRVCYQTEDYRETMNAFLEKRPIPPFKGR